MATPFTPGELTTAQARQLNELLRTREQFARLTVAAPLRLSRPAGIPCISLDQSGFPEPLEYAETAVSGGGGGVNITADNTWTVAATLSVPSAGRYLFQGQLSVTAQISAGPPGQIEMHLTDNAAPSGELGAMSGQVVTAQVINMAVAGTAYLSRVVTVAAPFTLAMCGLRFSGPTWATSQMNNAHGYRSFVSYLKIG